MEDNNKEITKCIPIIESFQDSESLKITDSYCIKKYFPTLQNDKYTKLKIDKIGTYSISYPSDALLITQYIKDLLEGTIIQNKNIIITDATAGVGGNTISFSNNFYRVNAIEKDKNRYHYLVNNTSVYGLNNIDFYNLDYNDLSLVIDQDVVFIDPPWGGRKYKLKDNIRIKLSNIEIETIVKNLITNKKAKLIILKLPSNYDFEYFDKIIEMNDKIMNKNMCIVSVKIDI